MHCSFSGVHRIVQHIHWIFIDISLGKVCVTYVEPVSQHS